MQNVECRKNKEKLQKSLKKVLTNAFFGGIIAKLSARAIAQAREQHRKYVWFRDSEMTIVQIGKGIFERARESETGRTLKIKQCKTRTKTHTIPVNSYSVLRRIRKQEIVFKL